MILAMRSAKIPKIIDLTDLSSVMSVFTGVKVLVGGCFDLLHIGHVRFLQAAKKQGEALIIALESDEFIQKRKGRVPFHTQTERAEILTALTCVDLVILLSFLQTYEEYLQLVKHVSPAVIAVTEGDPELIHKQQQANLVGGQVRIVIPRLNNHQTSLLLQKLSLKNTPT